MCAASAFALDWSDNGEDWKAASYNEKVIMSGVIATNYGQNSTYWLGELERYYARPINIGEKIRRAVHDIEKGWY